MARDEMVRTVLSKGGDVNDKCNKGCTLLMIASQEGHDKVVDTLLSSGAKLHDTVSTGWTAL